MKSEEARICVPEEGKHDSDELVEDSCVEGLYVDESEKVVKANQRRCEGVTKIRG